VHDPTRWVMYHLPSTVLGVCIILLSYEERIKQRNRIISKINATKADVDKYDEIIKKIEEEI
jgi:hypothetical protein